jgi:hypothetical protein
VRGLVKGKEDVVMGKVLVVGVAAVLAVTAGAFADLHIVQQFGMNFSDSPQNASATVSASGTATLSASGNFYSWVGWPANQSPVNNWTPYGISFNSANQGIGGSTNLASDPDGTGLVSFETVLQTLKQGTLDDLNVNIKDGAGWAFGVANNTLSISGSHTGGSIALALNLVGRGSMSSYTFDMTGASTGAYASGAFPSITYNVSPSGNASAAYSGTLAASLSVNGGGYFGVNGISIGASNTVGQTLSSGTMTLTELAGPYPKDVTVAIHADSGPVSLGISGSNGYTYNTYAGAGSSYYVVNLNYGVSGNANVSSHIDLYDTIVDAIPEPITLAVFGLGGALFTLARRRQTR